MSSGFIFILLQALSASSVNLDVSLPISEIRSVSSSNFTFVDHAIGLIESFFFFSLELLFALPAFFQVGGRSIGDTARLDPIRCAASTPAIGVCHHHASREAIAANSNS